MSGRLPRLAGVVATVDTADQGYFFGGVVHWPTALTVGLAVGVNDQIRTIQFVLPFRAVVRRIALEISTLSVGDNLGVGLYDASGNLILESGAISTTTTGVKTASITAVTLEPGVYFHAETADNTTVQIRKVSISSNVRNLLNAYATDKCGIAANTSTAGVLPATLGAITATTNVPSLVLYEP